MTRHKLGNVLSSQTVVIVGGGIAGLSTALALSNADIPSLVLERGSFHDEFGGGIQLTPNATSLLFKLGVQDALLSSAFPCNTLLTRHWKTGKTINHVPIGKMIKKKCNTPFLNLLRSQLVQILADQCSKSQHIELRSNSNVNKVEIEQDRVSLYIDSQQLTAPWVIGADGVHSTIGKKFFRPKPEFSGWMAWRCVINKPVPTHKKLLDATHVWCGTDAHIVHYPVDQKGTLNCVFVTRSQGRVAKGWREAGNKSEIQGLFKHWNGAISELIDQIDESSLFRWNLYRYPQLKTWPMNERILMLGDAVHSIMPFLAQGAALAIEDALTLANCLRKNQNGLTKPFHQFVSRRLKRTRTIQSMSQSMGSVYHFPPPLSTMRDLGTSFAIKRLVMTVYGFDASASV